MLDMTAACTPGMWVAPETPCKLWPEETLLFLQTYPLLQLQNNKRCPFYLLHILKLSRLQQHYHYMHLYSTVWLFFKSLFFFVWHLPYSTRKVIQNRLRNNGIQSLHRRQGDYHKSLKPLKNWSLFLSHENWSTKGLILNVDERREKWTRHEMTMVLQIRLYLVELFAI